MMASEHVYPVSPFAVPGHPQRRTLAEEVAPAPERSPERCAGWQEPGSHAMSLDWVRGGIYALLGLCPGCLAGDDSLSVAR